MATIKLTNVKKVYEKGNKPAVQDFNLEIKDKEFVVFVGPSGCGKSTTLRMIAGLEDITDGTIEIDGVVVNDLQPKDRDIAMVFQNYALYPHLTVFENMAFPLRLKKVPQDEVYKKVTEAAEILGITEYLTRKPRALSGGQRQRVAIGRAMVRASKVFLMDEPLSNLDAKLRATMRSEIIKLHDKLGATFIYVTHDQVEAMTMGTRIVVMKDGFVQQIGAPQHLYDDPANVFVAGFIGTPQMNFFDGRVFPDGKIVFANNQTIKLPADVFAKFDDVKIGDGLDVILGIRPGDIKLTDTFTENETVSCKVEVIEALGNETIVYADLDKDADATMEHSPTAITASLKLKQNPSRGDMVYFDFDLDKIHLFERETQKTIKKQ